MALGYITNVLLFPVLGQPANLADENAARPIVFVDGDEAPMLLLHGEDDDSVLVFNTIVNGEHAESANSAAKTIDKRRSAMRISETTPVERPAIVAKIDTGWNTHNTNRRKS